MRSKRFYLFVVFTLLSLFLFSCRETTSTESPERPNILFCIMDDASFPHMGAYGTEWVKTPSFDRVAQEGILFTRAYTPNAKCAPSRSCILTGRNSWQLEEAANHWPFFPSKFKTYAESLKETGYLTGFTGKGWAPGKPGMINGERRQLLGPNYSEIKLTPPAAYISNTDYAANFAAFLNDRSEDQPFSFWYGASEPHRAYEFGASIHKGGKKLSDLPEEDVPGFWPATDSVRTDILDYAFEIEHFDQHLGFMLTELEERGLLENTLIVVTADNGMPFPRVKGQAYEMSNHLPMAIMWKGKLANPGRRVDDYISFIDLAPTFLEVAQVTNSNMEPIQGKSLLPIITSQKSGTVDPSRDHVLIGKERHDIGRPNDWGYPIRGIVKGNWLYVHQYEPDRWPAGNPETGYLNTDGSPTKSVILNLRRRKGSDNYWDLNFGKRPAEQLYRLDQDPDCINNLADNPEYADQKAQLAQQLTKELTEQGDPRMFGQGHLFDEYLYTDTTSQGFYERYMAGEKMKAGWVNESDFEKSEVK